MQKLIYINNLGEELLMSNEGSFILAHIEGTGAVGRKIASIDGVGVAGEYITDARALARELRVTLNLRGTSRADLYRQRMVLCDRLSLEKVFNENDYGERMLASRLIYENDCGRWQTMGMVEDETDFRQRISHWHKDVRITFKCPDPYWYAIGEQTASIEFNDKAFRLPFRFPINFGSRMFETTCINYGSIKTSAVIEIHGRGEKPVLLNRRTGKRIKLKNAVPVGSVLTINTDARELNARIVDADGVESSAFGMLDPSYPISQWQLMPGENIVVYEPGAEAALTKVTIRWRSKYEGV